MKMFSYLFPEWNGLETTILTVKHASSNHIPRNGDMKDLASHHFKKVLFKVLKGEPEAELEKFFNKNGKDTVLVMGAYGRSAWSRMFHSSIANNIFKHLKAPLFITHPQA
jgi:nucleotide-binding universal stress UspA family protein